MFLLTVSLDNGVTVHQNHLQDHQNHPQEHQNRLQRLQDNPTKQPPLGGAPYMYGSDGPGGDSGVPGGGPCFVVVV